ncbi:hypothetical protein [Aliikangiella sp. IMCC44632]
MKISFQKIPKAAIILYLLGFAIIISCLLAFWINNQLVNPVRLQQALILGAIVVVGGSIVNVIYQFKWWQKQRDSNR